MMNLYISALETLKSARAALLQFIWEWMPIHPLSTLLLLGLAQGLVCMAVIPAWWHYDEPGHFEYVWLVAHSRTWPVEGQYDQAMRREMAVSMLDDGWYSIRNVR